MSGVAIIRALLVASGPLAAVVPATRILAGVLPEGEQLPAIAITEVSAVPVPRIDAQSPTSIVDTRVQVTVFSTDYPTQKQLLALVRQACNYQRGTLAAYSVISVSRISNGPDFSDPTTGMCIQSVDFSVLFNEPN